LAGSRIAPINVEDELDLTGDDDTSALSQTLQKQRAEAVRNQLPPSDKPTTLTNLTCVICMDTPTDLTATACGELFLPDRSEVKGAL
jgi:hypothetical protein